MKSIKRSLSALTCTLIGSDSMTPDTIRAARIAAGLTQKQLGEAVGLNPKSAQPLVAGWERGGRPVPRVRLKRVAEVLGLNVEDLLP